MEHLTYSESIPVMEGYDVVVAGGGLAGVAAALSAARQGGRVLLLEKQTWLGGLATTGLINFWVPLCNGRGKQIIRGMAEELLRLSVRYGFDTLPKEWKDGEPMQPTNTRYVTWFSSGLFALSLVELLQSEGVRILYDAWVSAPVMDGKRCRGLIVESKSGRQFYGAKMVVDATGDADVLKRAGVPTVDGKNYFTYIAEGVTLEGCRRAVQNDNVWYAYSRPSGGEANLYGGNQIEGVPLYEGISLESENDYLQRNQLLLLEKEKDKPRNARNIHMLPGMAQLRTARRLDGDATLTGEDCYRHHAASIGAICDFDHRDRLFEVPYGCLVRTGYENLITCGRSASASGWGWDVLRVIPPAVLTGQAAGIACMQAVRAGSPLPGLPVEPLQQALADTGVMIHFDDTLVPEDRTANTQALTEGHL